MGFVLLKHSVGFYCKLQHFTYVGTVRLVVFYISVISTNIQISKFFLQTKFPCITERLERKNVGEIYFKRAENIRRNTGSA